MIIIDILNLILAQFNLKWDNSKGLLYKYSDTIYIKIDANIQKVFEFIGITEDISTNFENTSVSSLFKSSNKIDTKALRLHLLDLDEDSEEYKVILDIVENCTGIDTIPYTDYLDIIEKYFEVDIKSQIEKAESQESKSKFNGNLIMYWMSDTKKGPIVKDTMKDFITHIEISKNMSFKSYVKLTKHKDIKEEFLSYMNINLD